MDFDYIEFNIIVTRYNIKFFNVVFFPAIFIMILDLMNVLFGSRDAKIRNGLTLLVVSVVILNIN